MGMGMGKGMGMGAGMGAPAGKGQQAQIEGDPNDPLNQFISRWGLDAGAAGMFKNSSPAIQQQALSNFNPGQSNNPSGNLVAFLKKLTSGGGQGMTNPQPGGASQYSPY